MIIYATPPSSHKVWNTNFIQIWCSIQISSIYRICIMFIALSCISDYICNNNTHHQILENLSLAFSWAIYLGYMWIISWCMSWEIICDCHIICTPIFLSHNIFILFRNSHTSSSIVTKSTIVSPDIAFMRRVLQGVVFEG